MLNPLFLCHGAPSLMEEKNEYVSFLKSFGKNMKPDAIVIFTAHWENKITQISSIDTTYSMIYDFYGFSKSLYEKKYPVKGSKEIASKISALLSKKNIANQLDDTRGLDHGSYSVLSLLFPAADIPVIQMSINPYATPKELFEIGNALQPLLDSNILIIGSGSTVHNLRTIDPTAASPEKWATEFDQWLIEETKSYNIEQLFQYKTLAPHVNLAIPREEHIAPYFITLGTSLSHTPKLLHQSYQYGTLSYIAFEF